VSSLGSKAKGFGARLGQAGAMGVVFAILFLAARATPTFHGAFGVIAAVGFLLLSGMLLSELLEVLGLPHLTGYLLAGVLAGPHVLHLVDHRAVVEMQPVNILALSLIALAGGAELRVDLLRSVVRSLLYSQLLQSVFVALVVGSAFFLLTPRIPFTSGFGPRELLGVALLWGVLAISRSPAATLGVLAQVKPDGPVTRFSLAFVMSSDVVVVVFLTLAIAVVRPLMDPAAGFSMHAFSELGHEILGSISLGTTLGVVLAMYLRLVGGQLLLVLVALGFGLTEALRYLRFDPLLAFMVAGFVVANMSRQGHKLLVAVEETGSIVFVVFFATAGAHLDVPLLAQLWPIALMLAGARAMASWAIHRFAARLAGDVLAVRRWAWSSLISQAGLTLGMAVVVERSFPDFGAGFRALAIATVAVNEMIGPVLFKFALDRCGESGKAVEKRLSNPDAVVATT
jgi:Kef-type K+ transport system membrane component KefB